MMLSAALMLEHGLARAGEAQRLDRAVWTTYWDGPVPDTGVKGAPTTSEFGDAVLRELS
jgi:isocitrate/isopropylmalate dehydrogenase